MSYDFARVAVVTGAGSGIGRALALALARRGAALALADQNGDTAEATAHACRTTGARARASTVDVTSQQAVLDYADGVQAEFGHAGLVFAAAGVIHTGGLLGSCLPDLTRVINVNLLGTVHTARAFLPALIASGNGHLVTFSSGFGLVAVPSYTAYSASKFAVRGFSEALQQEMTRARHPVAVTCVYPGRIRTPIVRNGSFAAGENGSVIATRFEQTARMGPERAAEIILRGVTRRRARVLVGADARAVALLAQLAGGHYQNVLPLLGRLPRKKR